MITAKFALQAKLKTIKSFEFNSYKEFFDFYITYNEKGIIFNVQDDGGTI
jgi:hypothetical protein